MSEPTADFGSFPVWRATLETIEQALARVLEDVEQHGPRNIYPETHLPPGTHAFLFNFEWFVTYELRDLLNDTFKLENSWP